ncbi:dihydrodipicolinate synthase family protein [Candidatus Woesearchaeota archaeon]|nr:dihydrodipicolinate synthase family protein [Candidatus Woesearchaeota archaeon]
MTLFKKEEFKGIVVPLATPLKEDYSFHRLAMERLIEHVIEGGVNGLFVLGSAGEFPLFDDGESLSIVRFVLKQTSQRVPVYANASRNSTEHTLKIARELRKAGVDAVVLMTPFYYSAISQDDLATHFLRIAEGGPAVLYNHPKTTKINIEVPTLEHLVNCSNIIGMKETSDDYERFSQVARLLPTLQGGDDRLLESMKRGGKGGVCGLANIAPGLFVRLINAYNSERFEEAEELQKKIAEMKQTLYKTPANAQVGVKQGLAYIGICQATMRPPMAQITKDQAGIINQYLREKL